MVESFLPLPLLTDSTTLKLVSESMSREKLYSEIGKRIFFIRQNAGLDQETFASEIGLSQSRFSEIETGKCRPSKRTLKLIAFQFKARPEWILSGSGEWFCFDEKEPGEINPKIEKPSHSLVAAKIDILPATIQWPVVVLSKERIDFALLKARIILESKNHNLSNALAINIDQFYQLETVGEDRGGALSGRSPPDSAEREKSAADPIWAEPQPAKKATSVYGP